MAIQKTDPQDIIIVKNIDTNCGEITTDVIPTTKKVRDPETDQVSTLYEDVVEEWNHADFFQVKWSGHPHRILPGQTRRMPRYIAEHYAKHLANHMLGKMEAASGRKGIVQSVTERPKMLKQIMIAVDEYFLQPEDKEEGARAVSEVDALNKGERPAMNLGEIPPTAVGVLKPEPKGIDEILKEPETKEQETMKDPPPPPPVETPVAPSVPAPETPNDTTKPQSDLKTSLFDKDKPLPARRELIKAAFDMGIELTGKESTDRIANLIKKF